MIPAIKAEFRKLLTVRSTYFILLFMLILEGIFAFWANGYRVSPAQTAQADFLARNIFDGVTALATFPAIVAVLLMTHEYRYNTILYSLTLSPSRLRVLLAKLFVISTYALVITAIFGGITLGLTLLGLHLGGHSLVTQSIPYHAVVWRVLFYGWGMGIAGLLLASLIRNQIAAVVSLLVVPGIIEQLLSLLLKKHSVYLPFTALGQVTGNNPGPTVDAHLSPEHAALVFLAWLVAGWIIAMVLFLRRDAN
jgi:ABC-type transport system involved in multi-copper enzyme maturation permease subunit